MQARVRAAPSATFLVQLCIVFGLSLKEVPVAYQASASRVPSVLSNPETLTYFEQFGFGNVLPYIPLWADSAVPKLYSSIVRLNSKDLLESTFLFITGEPACVKNQKCELDSSSQEFYEDWYSAEWFCDGHTAYPIGRDGHRLTLMIKCSTGQPHVPKTVFVKRNSTYNQKSEARGFFSYSVGSGCEGSVRDYSFNGPSLLQTYEITMCTQINRHEFNTLPFWIEYHSLLGFEHFFIYELSGETDELIEVLRRKSLHHLATIIPARFSDDDTFYFQIANQNDCIHRFKDRTRWLAMIDLDEFIQPMAGQSLTTLLERVDLERVGGVRLFPFFFGTSSKKSKKVGKSERQTRDDLVDPVNTYFWRASNAEPTRGKLIVRPENVQFFSCHMITTGFPTVDWDPKTEVRLNHYKLSHRGVYATMGGTEYDESASTLYKTLKDAKNLD